MGLNLFMVMQKINFEKLGGLVPVIIQDECTLEVLMLGFMNKEAYEKTLIEGRVTFFSRTKNRLWTKGEESGNYLNVSHIAVDCDNDTLLIKVIPVGHTCHTGARSCFNTEFNHNFIFQLERVITERFDDSSLEQSYIHHLKMKGLNKIAQKVGEEAVETVIAALNETEDDLVNEASDLLFHLLVLLKAKNLNLNRLAVNLLQRHRNRSAS